MNFVQISVDRSLMKAKSFIKRGEVDQAHTIYKSILLNFPENVRVKRALEDLETKIKINHNGLTPEEIINQLINLYNGGVLISSHDIDFLQKTCNKFIFLDGVGGAKFSIDLEKDLDFIVKGTKPGDHIQGSKNKLLDKRKPISDEKLIKRVMTKIEKKEQEIFKLNQKIQSLDKIDISDINYKKTLTQINEVQNELVLLEQEWIDLEEKNISN